MSDLTVPIKKEEPFRFEPEPVQFNFIGRTIKKITKDNPTAIKVAAYALIFFTFLCFALSMSALSTASAVGGLIGGLCLLPVGMEANKLRKQISDQEMREKIVNAFDKFDKAPVIKLPNQDFKEINLEDVPTIAKGKDKQGNLFVVFRVQDEESQVTYLEAIYQNESGEWRKKKGLKALPADQEKFDWKTWRDKAGFFKSYDSKLSKKDLKKLSETFNPK